MPDKVLHHTNKNAKPGKQGKGSKENYPVKNIDSANTLFENQRIFIQKYNIRYTTFRELYEIYISYIKHNKGLTPYALHSYLGSTGTYQALYKRLQTLKDRGLVYTSNRKYIPTDRVTSELSTILKSA